jgi:hypothetical protein
MKSKEDLEIECFKELVPHNWKMPSDEIFPRDKSVTRQAFSRGWDIREELLLQKNIILSTEEYELMVSRLSHYEQLILGNHNLDKIIASQKEEIAKLETAVQMWEEYEEKFNEKLNAANAEIKLLVEVLDSIAPSWLPEGIRDDRRNTLKRHRDIK